MRNPSPSRSVVLGLSTLLAVVFVAVSHGAVPPAPQDRPNVLLIVCDDLNTRLNCYGFETVKTPSLDQLCAAGVRFNRAYCQFPVCGPSRASFLSGMRPATTGITDNVKNLREEMPDTLMLPECFRTQGYWTAGVGKIFHQPRDREESFDAYEDHPHLRNPVMEAARQEFEAEHGSIDKPENVKAWKKLSQSKELRKRAAGQTPAGIGPMDLTDEEASDGRNARQVVKWLEDKAYGDKPFFITCGIHKPHVPFWAPKKYFAHYPIEQIELVTDPASDWDDIPDIALWGRYRSFFPVRNPSAQMRREAMQAYYACATYVDAQVGVMLEALRRLDLWNDTIVIFTSDHGYHLGEHGMWGKVTLYEDCDRIPFIIRVPGQKTAGQTSEALVELVDLYPTLADLCGLEMPADLEGLSMAPLVDEPDRPWKSAAFSMVRRGEKFGHALRTQRFKYAEYDQPHVNELYDLKQDPHEWTNLAKDPAYAEEVKRLRQMLRAGWRKALPESLRTVKNQ